MLRVSLGSHRLANDVANPFRYAWVSVMDESRSHTCGTGNGCDGKLSVTSNEIVDDLVERGECLRPGANRRVRAHRLSSHLPPPPFPQLEKGQGWY